MPNVVMMSVIYAECRKKTFMLSVIMLSVLFFIVILNVVILNVVAPLNLNAKSRSCLHLKVGALSICKNREGVFWKPKICQNMGK